MVWCPSENSQHSIRVFCLQRFCMLEKKYVLPFQQMFQEQYDTVHQLETNKLRNVAKFFAHLLYTDAILWEVSDKQRTSFFYVCFVGSMQK